jgi:hypothetical protein
MPILTLAGSAANDAPRPITLQNTTADNAAKNFFMIIPLTFLRNVESLRQPTTAHNLHTSQPHSSVFADRLRVKRRTAAKVRCSRTATSRTDPRLRT